MFESARGRDRIDVYVHVTSLGASEASAQVAVPVGQSQISSN